jgi:CheY-like chemotaxis protein
MPFGRGEDIFARGDGPILVMACEELSAKMTGAMLEFLGYATETVSDGESAVLLYRRRKEDGRPFVAVILDTVEGGDAGGGDTLRRLLDYDPAARVIVFSGYSHRGAMPGPAAQAFRVSLPRNCGIRKLGTVLRSVIRRLR